jgi:hypothetical protein
MDNEDTNAPKKKTAKDTVDEALEEKKKETQAQKLSKIAEEKTFHDPGDSTSGPDWQHVKGTGGSIPYRRSSCVCQH